MTVLVCIICVVAGLGALAYLISQAPTQRAREDELQYMIDSLRRDLE